MLNRRRGRRALGSAASTVAVIAWVTTCGAVLAGSAVAQIRVTSLQGVVTQVGSPLSLHAEVREIRLLEVPVDAHCSLLLADRALAEICGVALASFSETINGGSVELDVGELKVIAPDGSAVSVRTPTASIEVRRAAAHISVAPDSGESVVSALEGQLSVIGRDEKDATLVNAGQQLIVRRGRPIGDPRAVSRESLVGNNACMNEDVTYRAAVRAERAMLSSGAAARSSIGAAAGQPASDLGQIVKSDFPADGLPLEDAATPSALVTELGKRGMDEEICDPITCNPVYQLAPPPPCGVPPVRPCS